METIKNFKDLTRSVKNINTDNLKNINISILGNHSTQFFTKSIKNQLILAGFNPNIFEGDYDQIDFNILNPKSGLYSNNPDLIIIFES